MPTWLIGMFLALLGCCSNAIGLVLIKHSTAVESQLSFWRRRFWWTGFCFLIVNASIIDVVAFSLAPLALVAPFSGVAIVITTMLASSGLLYVKETLDDNDVTSTAITLLGVFITTAYGPHVDDGATSAAVLYSNFRRRDFAQCMSILVTILALAWAFEVVAAVRRQRSGQPVRIVAARIVLYAYTAALSGAFSMLLLKVIGTGLRMHIEHREPLLTSGWLLSFVGLGCCAVVQLSFLNRTLANSPVSYGVPTYQALLTVLTIITGGMFFSEFRHMPPFDQLAFSCGVLVTLLGVGLHTTHRSELQLQQQQQHDDPPLPSSVASPGTDDQPVPFGNKSSAGPDERTRLLAAASPRASADGQAV